VLRELRSGLTSFGVDSPERGIELPR
jgi:hypothetical protein